MVVVDTLKDAFCKLLSYTYFDKNDLRLRHNVANFAKLLVNIEEEERIFDKLCEVANGNNPELLELWLSNIELCFYPKKIKTSNNQGDDHFITNIPAGNAVVERLLAKSSFPVELMILDVAWLLEYGPYVEEYIKPSSYGNRLDLTLLGNKVRFGNSIFKKYIHQYQAWWNKGLRMANKVLSEGKNVSIINFDITNCYHSIDFNFDTFFDDFMTKHPNSDIRQNSLTTVVIRVYEKYWEIVNSSDAQPFLGENKGKHTMPLSLLSAHVLANWYISPLDDYFNHNYPELYYGRYVDDCMVVSSSVSETQEVLKHIEETLPGLIVDNNKDVLMFGFALNNEESSFNRLSKFSIQRDKLYMYYFDCKLPQQSLEKFKDEQMERSSEFRFLTDEADCENGQGLEFVTLVNTFDVQEETSRRFNILEENKYKLSVFFAKLNQRLAKFGKNYSHIEEVDKVFKYFHGNLLIKHYLLWEKMFTTFVLSGHDDYASEFYTRIEDEICLLDVEEQLFDESKNAGVENIRQSLLAHLKESYLIAKSLYKQAAPIDTIYLDTFMTRTYFNQFPLQEFTNGYIDEGVRLSMTHLQYNKNRFGYRWVPYYVKYYDIVCALTIENGFAPEVYKKAYTIYKHLNREIVDEGEWKVFMRKGRTDYEWEFNTSYFELPPPDKLTVSLVEMDLDEHKLSDTIDKFGKIDDNKINLMRTILDKVTEVSNTDIFVMPELTLPMYELHEFCQYSAKYSKAFIAGMEYVIKDKKAYNYIVTCLPIILYGQNDAVPIIRLKNYYAPEEIKLIKKKKLKIPQNKKNWKILYHWNGHVFTNFYCFELTSIKDRAYFQSMIDAVYCSVLNRDTPYFNSIAESCSRDLHCYFVLSNVSRYGDTRVTQPTSSVVMNIMRVKGGNTDDNKAVVLSVQIDIKGLRTFQKMGLAKQRSNKDKFKFTPPDFDKTYVDKRKERFLLATGDIFSQDFLDDFIANMYLDRMRPIL